MTITDQNKRAIEKASRVKCSVRILGPDRYLVTTPENHKYVVRFEMIEGVRFGRCYCKAGSTDMACYHICHAANVDDLRYDGRTVPQRRVETVAA